MTNPKSLKASFLLMLIIPSVVSIFALMIMLIWNYLLVWAISSIPMIDFWKAIAIVLILSAIEVYQIWKKDNANL